MYFPFLTCEVKGSASSPDVADRRNAHGKTVAVRGVVELFRLVAREKELHREILAFSISHDHAAVGNLRKRSGRLISSQRTGMIFGYRST
jgi:hypothetical protein